MYIFLSYFDIGLFCYFIILLYPIKNFINIIVDIIPSIPRNVQTKPDPVQWNIVEYEEVGIMLLG